MIRSIVAFHADLTGDWVAELSCYHNQHIRHRPPFQPRPWVDDAVGRAGRIGSPIDCPLCDRAELPAGLAVLNRLGPWDQESLPVALCHAHQTPRGQWGQLQVRAGAIDFQFEPGRPDSAVTHLQAGSHQPIPPGRTHRVMPTGDVKLELELWGKPGN